jgi:NADPH:quinone reductase-like Zn-dependent oxidoreductase
MESTSSVVVERRNAMPRAVRFDKYGGLEVLQVVEVDRPTPGTGQVLVRVKAAGINPGEASIRKGMFADRWPSTFPSGQGSDLAGVVEEVGPGVANVAVGDEVIGFTNSRSSQAEFVLVESGNLVPRPANVSWEQAGAAGGVGSIAVQLARNAGAKVIGLSSDANRKWLDDHGVIPVTYGDGVEDRIRAASGGKVNAFIDTFGGGYVELALKLGVAPNRIDTIIDFAAAAKYGVKTEGNYEAATADVLAQLAGLLAAGRLEIPIAKVYPLAEVRDAYRDLEQRHTRGKIVLEP